MASFTNTALGEYAKRIKGLTGQEDKTFKLVLNTTSFKENIVQLNLDQLENSIDSEGNPLFNTFTGRSFYAQSDPLGRGGQPYQVFRTGFYYTSIQATVFAGFILIVSNPNKGGDNLFEIYTENLEGLTTKNKQEIQDEALTLYIQWYQRNILPK